MGNSLAVEGGVPLSAAPGGRSAGSLSPATGSMWRPAELRSAVGVLGRMMLNLPHTAWVVLDLAVLITGLWVGFRYFVRPVVRPYPHVGLWQAYTIFAACLVVSSLIFGLNERETIMGRSCILIRMLLTSGTATVSTLRP